MKCLRFDDHEIMNMPGAALTAPAMPDPCVRGAEVSNPTAWRKIAAGEWQSRDGQYRAVLGWGDAPGWTLIRISGNGDTEILNTLSRLRDAKAEAR